MPLTTPLAVWTVVAHLFSDAVSSVPGTQLFCIPIQQPCQAEIVEGKMNCIHRQLFTYVYRELKSSGDGVKHTRGGSDLYAKLVPFYLTGSGDFVLTVVLE